MVRLQGANLVMQGHQVVTSVAGKLQMAAVQRRNYKHAHTTQHQEEGE